jgi:hypothetical protein
MAFIRWVQDDRTARTATFIDYLDLGFSVQIAIQEPR